MTPLPTTLRTRQPALLMIVDVSIFALVPNADPSAFLEAVRTSTLQLQRSPGFQARALGFDPHTGRWTDHLYFHSRTDAEQAIAAYLTSDEARAYLHLVDPRTLQSTWPSRPDGTTGASHRLQRQVHADRVANHRDARLRRA